MESLIDLFEGLRLGPNALLDIALTAVLIYGVFSLIQGTRAVRVVIGVILLYVVFISAQALELVLLTSIMQTGAVVGLVALVVIFQPELRRGLDRLGRVGSLRWLGPSDTASHQRVAAVLASAATALSKRRIGALVVVQRDSGLGDMAETGVPLDAILSVDLLTSIFETGAALHDGAAVVSGDKIVAAGVMLPLADRGRSKERYGTRHRAAMGVTEQTDALAIVVSEETGAISLAESGGFRRELGEEDLRQRLFSLLSPVDVRGTARSMATLGGRHSKAPGKGADTMPGSAADESTAIDRSDDVDAVAVVTAAHPDATSEAISSLPLTVADKPTAATGSARASE